LWQEHDDGYSNDVNGYGQAAGGAAGGGNGH
jgi:hypothetical protein